MDIMIWGHVDEKSTPGSVGVRFAPVPIPSRLKKNRDSIATKPFRSFVQTIFHSCVLYFCRFTFQGYLAVRVVVLESPSRFFQRGAKD